MIQLLEITNTCSNASSLMLKSQDPASARQLLLVGSKFSLQDTKSKTTITVPSPVSDSIPSPMSSVLRGMICEREKSVSFKIVSPEWLLCSAMLGGTFGWRVSVSQTVSAVADQTPVVCWGRVVLGNQGLEFPSMPEVYRDLEELIGSKTAPRVLIMGSAILAALVGAWFVGKATVKFTKKWNRKKKAN